MQYCKLQIDLLCQMKSDARAMTIRIAQLFDWTEDEFDE